MAMDRTADPCVDFYQFACGGWMKNNPIPPDQSSWTTYGKMQDDNRALLRALLEHFAPGTARPHAQPAEDRRLLRRLHGRARDRPPRRSPLAPQMAAIATIASIADIAAVVADSHRTMLVLGPILFSLRAEQDAKNSTETIAGIDQGGLGLPDRDYYLKDDERSVALRDEVCRARGARVPVARRRAGRRAASAQTVLRIETELAKGQMSRVDRRNPDNTYHRLPRAKLKELMPSWPWDAYFKQMGIAQIADLNIASPGYFSALERQLTSVPLTTGRPTCGGTPRGWRRRT